MDAKWGSFEGECETSEIRMCSVFLVFILQLFQTQFFIDPQYNHTDGIVA